jgi:hypothetical protein
MPFNLAAEGNVKIVTYLTYIKLSGLELHQTGGRRYMWVSRIAQKSGTEENPPRVYPILYILAVMKNAKKERISAQTMILKALLFMSD